MLLIAVSLSILASQSIFTGSDRYPPTSVDERYIYRCGAHSYRMELRRDQSSDPSLFAIEVDGVGLEGAVLSDLHTFIGRYRSIFSWNASCKSSNDGLVIFARGYIDDDGAIDDEDGVLTTIEISVHGEVVVSDGG